MKGCYIYDPWWWLCHPLPNLGTLHGILYGIRNTHFWPTCLALVPTCSSSTHKTVLHFIGPCLFIIEIIQGADTPQLFNTELSWVKLAKIIWPALSRVKSSRPWNQVTLLHPTGADLNQSIFRPILENLDSDKFWTRLWQFGLNWQFFLNTFIGVSAYFITSSILGPIQLIS